MKPIASKGTSEKPKKKITSIEEAVEKKKRQAAFNVSKKTINWDVLEGTVRRSKRKHTPWTRYNE